jgi:hypothetical protein
MVDATVSSGTKTVLVPITPCRIIDTRPAFQVGLKSSPLGPGEILKIAGRGTSGQCTIPGDAVGLSLNVTTVGATLPTFLTVWATGATQPNASNLNPTPGAPPTPNAVTTELSSGGEFNIYNLQGNVHVFADVNGYYADHNHDDRYYTKTQVENLVFDGTIPSGVTVTGNIYWDSHGSSSQSSDTVSVAFPGRAPVPLTNAKVNFDQAGVTGDGDPECNGNASAPTAPAGKVCIYLSDHNGMATNTLIGYAGFPLADAGFLLQWAPDGTDDIDEYVSASWAYTAP